MPLFYFEVQIDGIAQGAPQSPIELKSLHHAWEEGVLTAADYLREIADRFEPGSTVTVLVQDGGRNTVGTITIQGSG